MRQPRLMAKVGQAYEPKEYEGKWFVTIWLKEFGTGEPTDADIAATLGPWETEAEAKQHMKNAVRLGMESISEKLGAIKGKYIDVKTNELREWGDEN